MIFGVIFKNDWNFVSGKVYIVRIINYCLNNGIELYELL